MLVTAFLHLCMKEDLAGIADTDVLIAAFDVVGHGEEVHAGAV